MGKAKNGDGLGWPRRREGQWDCSPLAPWAGIVVS